MLRKRSTPEKIKDEENQSDDHDQNIASSQETNQSVGPVILSPFKKQRPDHEIIFPQETPVEKNIAYTDDRVEREDLGSSSRSPSPEIHALSMTLNWSDIIQRNSCGLKLGLPEARTLSNDPDITHHPPYKYLKDIVVIDAENRRRYDMQISNYICDSSIQYWLGRDWEIFVGIHDLKDGDEVSFHKLKAGGWLIKVNKI